MRVSAILRILRTPDDTKSSYGFIGCRSPSEVRNAESLANAPFQPNYSERATATAIPRAKSLRLRVAKVEAAINAVF